LSNEQYEQTRTGNAEKLNNRSARGAENTEKGLQEIKMVLAAPDDFATTDDADHTDKVVIEQRTE